MKYFIYIIIAAFFFSACDEDNSNDGPKVDPAEVHFSKAQVSATVTWLYDGDSFECQSGEYSGEIRALGIDAYESTIGSRLESQAEKAGISVDSAAVLGRLAKSFAIQTLSNKEILLVRDYSERNRDVYDRYLRWIFVDGKSYDSMLLDLGYALPY